MLLPVRQFVEIILICEFKLLLNFCLVCRKMVGTDDIVGVHLSLWGFNLEMKIFSKILMGQPTY